MRLGLNSLLERQSQTLYELSIADYIGFPEFLRIQYHWYLEWVEVVVDIAILVQQEHVPCILHLQLIMHIWSKQFTIYQIYYK